MARDAASLRAQVPAHRRQRADLDEPRFHDTAPGARRIENGDRQGGYRGPDRYGRRPHGGIDQREKYRGVPRLRRTLDALRAKVKNAS